MSPSPPSRQWIDAVKLRLQLQGQASISSGGSINISGPPPHFPYTAPPQATPRLGMLAMARHMLQHEGVGGFFKGLTPALLRQGAEGDGARA